MFTFVAFVALSDFISLISAGLRITELESRFPHHDVALHLQRFTRGAPSPPDPLALQAVLPSGMGYRHRRWHEHQAQVGILLVTRREDNNLQSTFSDEIYIAPSGVQKERMQPEDLFVQDITGKDLQLPPEIRGLKKSQCTPLFMLAYQHRGAGAVIHTHSQHAVMATLLWPGKTFRCTHLEMIKGVYDEADKRYLRYDEELVVPIIENTPFERDLADSMYAAMMEYPGCSAILVRRHGVYVWGQTWEKAKTM